MSSEADTHANYIDPAIKAASWIFVNILREQCFNDGRKIADKVRGGRYFVEYLLHKDIRNFTVVEAKKESELPAKGLQLAIDYVKKLRVRFVYSSTGKQTYEFDLEAGKGDQSDFYPTHSQLETRYLGEPTSPRQRLRNIPYLVRHLKI